MSDLVIFEQQIDPRGYEIVEAPVVDKRPRVAQVRARGGGTDRRRLDKSTELFLKFARTPPTPEGVLGFANQFGLLQPSHQKRPSEPLQVWYDRITRMREAVDLMDAGCLEDVCARTNDWTGTLRPRLIYNPAAHTALFCLQPTSLHDLLWLQLLTSCAVGALFRQCEECGEPFRYGPGTERRATARFCTDRCRKKR